MKSDYLESVSDVCMKGMYVNFRLMKPFAISESCLMYSRQSTMTGEQQYLHSLKYFRNVYYGSCSCSGLYNKVTVRSKIIIPVFDLQRLCSV